MSLPETGFDFQDTQTQIDLFEPIKKNHILPRMVRLNAPYYIFYHNTNYEQYKSLLNVITKAGTYDLWFPSLEGIRAILESQAECWVILGAGSGA